MTKQTKFRRDLKDWTQEDRLDFTNKIGKSWSHRRYKTPNPDPTPSRGSGEEESLKSVTFLEKGGGRTAMEGPPLKKMAQKQGNQRGKEYEDRKNQIKKDPQEKDGIRDE